jgi:predicted DsbA family dithiol-disulfide isomerase
LSLYKDVESVPVVLIFDVKRKQCKEINGPKNKDVYKAAIEKVIAKGQ